MPVSIENYDYCYLKNGRYIFAPSDKGRLLGKNLKLEIENNYIFPPLYYHLINGGHVGALHAHRANRYFCKIDVQNFFYSISRNRIMRALDKIGIAEADEKTRWSCVANPLAVSPKFVLPYGFIQSPILATLIIDRSIGEYLRFLSTHYTVAIYVDDISVSGNNLSHLNSVYAELREKTTDANFTLNADKCREPCEHIEIFNCELSQGRTAVTERRKTDFTPAVKSRHQKEAFERYCDSVSDGNL